MKRIVWKATADTNTTIGFVRGIKSFIIEGCLCLTDMRETYNTTSVEDYVAPKHYRIKDKVEAKKIAHELLNDLNVEVHESNYKERLAERTKSIDLINSAEELLKSLKKAFK